MTLTLEYHHRKMTETFWEFMSASNNSLPDVSVHCQDGTVHTNKLLLAMIFPSICTVLSESSVVVLDHITTSSLSSLLNIYKNPWKDTVNIDVQFRELFQITDIPIENEQTTVQTDEGSRDSIDDLLQDDSVDEDEILSEVENDKSESEKTSAKNDKDGQSNTQLNNQQLPQAYNLEEDYVCTFDECTKTWSKQTYKNQRTSLKNTVTSHLLKKHFDNEVKKITNKSFKRQSCIICKKKIAYRLSQEKHLKVDHKVFDNQLQPYLEQICKKKLRGRQIESTSTDDVQQDVTDKVASDPTVNVGNDDEITPIVNNQETYNDNQNVGSDDYNEEDAEMEEADNDGDLQSKLMEQLSSSDSEDSEEEDNEDDESKAKGIKDVKKERKNMPSEEDTAVADEDIDVQGIQDKLVIDYSDSDSDSDIDESDDDDN